MGDDGEAVVIRAFRGTRRASVYRDHAVAAAAFARIRATAERMNLHVLSSLGLSGSHELDKETAGMFAEEVTAIRSSGDLVELDDDLTALAEVARWCRHARRGAWLRIEGSQPDGGDQT